VENQKNGLGTPYQYNYYDRPIEVILAAPNVPVQFNFKTSVATYNIVGILANVFADDNDDNGALNRIEFSQPLVVDQWEIFPEKWDLRNISTGMEVSPDDRYWTDICASSNGNAIKGALVCKNAKPALYPIVVKFWLRCTQKDLQAKDLG